MGTLACLCWFLSWAGTFQSLLGSYRTGILKNIGLRILVRPSQENIDSFHKWKKAGTETKWKSSKKMSISDTKNIPKTCTFCSIDERGHHLFQSLQLRRFQARPTFGRRRRWLTTRVVKQTKKVKQDEKWSSVRRQNVFAQSEAYGDSKCFGKPKRTSRRHQIRSVENSSLDPGAKGSWEQKQYPLSLAGGSIPCWSGKWECLQDWAQTFFFAPTPW